MKHYTIYNQSGEIVRFGQTKATDLSSIQLQDGMQIIELQCPQDAHLYKVTNGEIVKRATLKYQTQTGQEIWRYFEVVETSC